MELKLTPRECNIPPDTLWKLCADYTAHEDTWGGHDHKHTKLLGYARGDQKAVEDYTTNMGAQLISDFGISLEGDVNSICVNPLDPKQHLNLDDKVLDLRKLEYPKWPRTPNVPKVVTLKEHLDRSILRRYSIE
jgi:hypothetical protein